MCACAEGPGLISASRLWPGGPCSSSGDAGEGGVTAEPVVGTALVWALVGGVCVRWVPGCPLRSVAIHGSYGATAGQWLDLVALKVGVEYNTSMALGDISPAFPPTSRGANLIKH